MSEKRFEEDKVESYDNEYNYSLLDTYYEFENDRIIEWNKHKSNAEYFDLENLVNVLNVKEMRLESCQKGGKEEYERRVKLIQECNQLKEENEQLRKDNEELYQSHEDMLHKYLKLKSKIYKVLEDD